jgi:hypothetical protein
MADDPATGNMILFSGVTSSAHVLDDTWGWNGSNWTNLHPANSPRGRIGSGMDFDSATGTLILFGGWTNNERNDTWAWTGSNWVKQSPTTSPPARSFAASAFDPGTGGFLVFGGVHGSVFVADTWNYAL